MNDELRHRSIELGDTNSFLETVLSTIGVAVVGVDRDHQVRIWNDQARELWGLTSEEVDGQNVFALDIGLPLAQLRPQLTGVMSGELSRDELVVEATNRRGRNFQCRLTFMRMGRIAEDGSGGAVMMMENVDSDG